MGTHDAERDSELEREIEELRRTIRAMCEMGMASLDQRPVGGEERPPAPLRETRV